MAVSYDSREQLAKFAQRAKIAFPLLADPDSKVIKAYGILNDKAKGGMAGIPHPGTFVIGQDGKVQHKIFYTVRKRHTADELLQRMKKSK